MRAQSAGAETPSKQVAGEAPHLFGRTGLEADRGQVQTTDINKLQLDPNRPGWRRHLASECCSVEARQIKCELFGTYVFGWSPGEPSWQKPVTGKQKPKTLGERHAKTAETQEPGPT